MDPKTKRRTGTETSMMQKIEYEADALQESPSPPIPPELPDAGSITGLMPLPKEVADRAKEDDDTAKNDPAS
jgi:hypothetical protein